MRKAIAYYRVSTERQGESGLGLDAQKYAVKHFAQANGYLVTDEFIEIESGKKSNRPLLQCALEKCQTNEALLLIARLDRLGRNVAFISRLLESHVEFKAVDNPHAGKLVVHIMAAFAEYERDEISRRTKAALQAAKQRGTELGKNGKYVLSKKNKDDADFFAQSMKPIIADLKENGIKTVRQITTELNKTKVPTFKNDGSKWHLSTVQNLLKRLRQQE